MENYLFFTILAVTILIFCAVLYRHFLNNFSNKSAWLFLLFIIPIFIIVTFSIIKGYSIIASLSTSFSIMISQSCRDLIAYCSKNLLMFSDPIDGMSKISLIMIIFSFIAALGMNLGRYFSTLRFIRLISARKVEPDAKTTRLFNDLIAKLDIKNVSLSMINSSNPLAFNVGVFKPIVYLSRNLMEILEIDELKSVILHELVHIKRRDNIKQWIGMFLKESTWFLPTSNFCWKHFIKEREESADKKVVDITGQPLDMASALLKYIKSFQKKPIWVAGLANHYGVKDRIDKLAGKKDYNDKTIGLKSLVIMVGLTLVILSTLILPPAKSALADKQSIQLPACCLQHNHISCSTSNCGFFSN